MAAAAESALHLPQDILAKWIQSGSPTVDLRDAHLSHVQWARLAMALAQSQAQAPTVTTLHFAVASKPQPVVHSQEMDRFRHLMQFWSCQRSMSSHCCNCGKETTGMCSKISVGFQCQSTTCRQFCGTTYAPVYDIKAILSLHERSPRSCADFIHNLKDFCASAPETPAYCCACKGTFWGQPSLLLFGFVCSTCGKLCPAKTARPPSVPVLSLMAGGWSTTVSNEVTQVLSTLAGAAFSMANLQHLGLHHLPLIGSLVPVLGQIFGALHRSLATLTLDAYIVNRSTFGAPEKALFFGAVARAQKLKELHMLEWEGMIGSDAEVCVAALQSLLHLEAIVVFKLKESVAFPALLPFREADLKPY